jgi:hypothetical protein
VAALTRSERTQPLMPPALSERGTERSAALRCRSPLGFLCRFVGWAGRVRVWYVDCVIVLGGGQKDAGGGAGGACRGGGSLGWGPGQILEALKRRCVGDVKLF